MAQIKKMWNYLLQGIEVIKHGRSGKPKTKMLFCDYMMTKLYWRSSDSKPDPFLSAAVPDQPPRDDEERSEDTNHHTNSSLTMSAVTESNAATLSGAQGNKKYRFLKSGFHDPFRRTSFTKSDGDREIYFKDILTVCFFFVSF
jgi:hypothetical protein